MSRVEEVELTNMCMVYDDQGNVLVQDKKHPTWNGWNFPGGHVEAGEAITASVIREVYEETGLVIKNPKLCGIKEFHKSSDGKRYIVFLYKTNEFSGELHSSEEGEIFWCPLDKLDPQKLVKSFDEILRVFASDDLSEVFYERCDGELRTVYY